MQENVFDHQSDRYEAWFDRNPRILDSEVEAISQLLPSNGEGVEIGVGTGIFAARLGIRHGVEPSDAMGRRAVEKGIHVIHGIAEKLPIADRSYSYALMVTVDCFLQDIAQAFREVRRILSEDGCFIIAFIDRETPLGILYEQNKHRDDVYKHADFHSSDAMAAFLHEAGFDVQARRQTVFSFENVLHDVRDGCGEGVFAVIRAKTRPLAGVPDADAHAAG